MTVLDQLCGAGRELAERTAQLPGSAVQANIDLGGHMTTCPTCCEAMGLDHEEVQRTVREFLERNR